MTDLRSRLDKLGGPVTPPAPGTVAADLDRARRAARRRTTVRAAGATLGIAAVAAGTVLAVISPSAPGPAVSSGASSGAPVQYATGVLRLVAYAGDQPGFFTIDVVPEGFFIQAQTESTLMIAPAAAQNPGPDVNPSVDWLYNPDVYTGKIGVYLQHQAFLVAPETYEKLTIGGRPAAFRDLGGGDAQIFINETPTILMTIQFDSDPSLTKAQMIEIAGGVHATPEAAAQLQAAYDRASATPKPTSD